MTVATTVLNPGHTDRLVELAEVGGRTVVRKRCRDATGPDVHTAMTSLWASPFGRDRQPPGLPEPLGLDTARGTLTMAYVRGAPLGARGDLGLLPDHIDAVAGLLAGLHSSGVDVARRRHPAKLVRSLRRLLADDPRHLAERIAVHSPVSITPVLNHGDFSPRNVLLGDAGPVLIDFDRLQMASAGRDVQYMAAWCWATQATTGTELRAAWDLGAEFEHAYSLHRPEASVELATGRIFHRAAALVRIAMEWSTMAADPDARALVLDEAERLVAAAP